MAALRDNWCASYSRYMDISSDIQYRDDSELKEKLLYYVASASGKNWRWAYAIPKTERDSKHFVKVNQFVKENYPIFGKKEWKLQLRIAIFLAHYYSGVSFATAYFLNQTYRIILGKHRRKKKTVLKKAT